MTALSFALCSLAASLAVATGRNVYAARMLKLEALAIADEAAARLRELDEAGKTIEAAKQAAIAQAAELTCRLTADARAARRAPRVA